MAFEKSRLVHSSILNFRERALYLQKVNDRWWLKGWALQQGTCGPDAWLYHCLEHIWIHSQHCTLFHLLQIFKRNNSTSIHRECCNYSDELERCRILILFLGVYHFRHIIHVLLHGQWVSDHLRTSISDNRALHCATSLPPQSDTLDKHGDKCIPALELFRRCGRFWNV